MLKVGATLEGIDFPMTDFRLMLAFRFFKRWQFATTTFVELPPAELDEFEEVVVDDDPGEPNPKDCCMPFALWCNSWQVSDARRFWWQNTMPEDLQSGVRVLNVERHRDLLERFTGEIPEWAIQQTAFEAHSKLDMGSSRNSQKNPLHEEYSLIHEDEDSSSSAEEVEGEEFARALCAIVLRNAVGPASIGFRGKRNLREIADTLGLGSGPIDFPGMA